MATKNKQRKPWIKLLFKIIPLKINQIQLLKCNYSTHIFINIYIKLFIIQNYCVYTLTHKHCFLECFPQVDSKESHIAQGTYSSEFLNACKQELYVVAATRPPTE